MIKDEINCASPWVFLDGADVVIWFSDELDGDIIRISVEDDWGDDGLGVDGAVLVLPDNNDNDKDKINKD